MSETTKPDWCDERVWEISDANAPDVTLSGSRQEASEIIAFVAMRAYEAGVEKAASLCDKRGDWGKEDWDEYVALGKKGHATAYHEWFYTMGAFIRRFGPFSQTEPDIAQAIAENRSKLYWDGK
jgi:hypothetical protein